MAVNLPTFNHSRVDNKPVYNSEQEDHQCEKYDDVQNDKDHEMNEGPNGWTEICWQISILPYHPRAYEEVICQDGHAEHAIEDEAKEVRECIMRHAVGCPGTVVVHFWDTS